MRICVLSISNLKHMTAASMYFDFLDAEGMPFDLIYMDKYGIEESAPNGRVFKYHNPIVRRESSLKKSLRYAKFLVYAAPLLIRNRYDVIIVWGVETSFLFSLLLLTRWRDRFILNIRDYPLVRFPGTFSILRALIKAARNTVISSPAYLTFLPKSRDYVQVHSVNKKIVMAASVRSSKRGMAEPIRIGFIGYVRFFEVDKSLLEELGNDPRFVIQFFGPGSEVLSEYAQSKGILNVEFEPGFDTSRTSELLDRIDILNNLYGQGSLALDTAVSIKYYYSVLLRIPILVFQDTFMADVASQTGLAVKSELTGLADLLYEWYQGLDFDLFSAACVRQVDEIARQNGDFYLMLQETLKSSDA